MFCSFFFEILAMEYAQRCWFVVAVAISYGGVAMTADTGEKQLCCIPYTAETSSSFMMLCHFWFGVVLFFFLDCRPGLSFTTRIPSLSRDCLTSSTFGLGSDNRHVLVKTLARLELIDASLSGKVPRAMVLPSH